MEEGDDLSTGAGQFRGEGGAAGAMGDTFGSAPFYCFGIPVTVCDVVKEEICIDIRRAGLAMEEDHGFGTGDGLIWGEGGCTCATDESFAIASFDGVILVDCRHVLYIVVTKRVETSLCCKCMVFTPY